MSDINFPCGGLSFAMSRLSPLAVAVVIQIFTHTNVVATAPILAHRELEARHFCRDFVSTIKDRASNDPDRTNPRRTADSGAKTQTFESGMSRNNLRVSLYRTRSPQKGCNLDCSGDPIAKSLCTQGSMQQYAS